MQLQSSKGHETRCQFLKLTWQISSGNLWETLATINLKGLLRNSLRTSLNIFEPVLGRWQHILKSTGGYGKPWVSMQKLLGVWRPMVEGWNHQPSETEHFMSITLWRETTIPLNHCFTPWENHQTYWQGPMRKPRRCKISPEPIPSNFILGSCQGREETCLLLLKLVTRPHVVKHPQYPLNKHSYGKSPFLMVESTTNGNFQ